MASSERVSVLTADQGLDCEDEHLKAIPSEAFKTQIPQSKFMQLLKEKESPCVGPKHNEDQREHEVRRSTRDFLTSEKQHDLKTIEVEEHSFGEQESKTVTLPGTHDVVDIPEEECVTITESLNTDDELFMRSQEDTDQSSAPIESVIENQSVFGRLTRQSQTIQDDNAFDTLVRTACENFNTGTKGEQPQHQTLQGTVDQELITVVSHGLAPSLATAPANPKPANQDISNFIESQKNTGPLDAAVNKRDEVPSIPVTNVLDVAVSKRDEVPSIPVTNVLDAAVSKRDEVPSIPVTNVLEEAIASQNLATLAREAVIQESLVIGAQIVDRRLRDEDKSQDEYDVNGIRKSVRKRKPTRPKSPETEIHSFLKKKKQRRPAHVIVQDQTPSNSNGEPFRCDLCNSPYVTNPSRRGNRPKTSTNQPSPRHKRDPTTGRMLTLCNACGLSFDRPKKQRREKAVLDPEEKRKYLEESRQFALSLVEGLGEPEAERLSCPHYKVHACACLQKYIIGDGDMHESRGRATNLLDLLKQARVLSKEKCYDAMESKMKNGRSRRSKNIGLGNGQRKSKAFENFIIEKRKYLREELKLCERATQRVLLYSNNFLHKKLKTDPTKPIRVERQKGRAALGKLKPIQELPQEKCCVDSCVMIAITHSKLLQQWRDRAVSGQTEARRVLAEMLTPSGGARSNCYKFISWVTGCSHSTIGRVNEQMRETGGDREPPTHGLIKWWKENPKPKKIKPKPVSQTSIQAETVQQIALQQIQQVLPQVNILQAAVSSAGLTAVMMQPAASSVAQPLSTVNTQQLAQTQFVPAVAFSNGTIQVQATPAGQIQVQPSQQIQVQQQQLHQQQIQYQQQIQQLQFQQFQLQQQQQQLQQQLQQTQQAQAATTTVELQEIEQQENQDSDEHQLQAQEQATTQEADETVVTTSSENVTPTSTNMSPLAPPQPTPLTPDGFLTADALQILNAVQSGQVVTLPASAVTQTVPVSLIQTPVTSLP